MASSESPPPWLLDAFPGFIWKSVRTCHLNVKNGGAGLDLVASEFGYLIDSVDESPGQDSGICGGAVVIAVNSVQLLGLTEDTLEDTFGKHFQHKVPLIIADFSEVQSAAIQRDSQEECPCNDDVGEELPEEELSNSMAVKHDNTVQIPLTFTLDFHQQNTLSSDLQEFRERTGVYVTFETQQHQSPPTLVLHGVPEEVQAAHTELNALLAHYEAQSSCSAALKEEDNVEKLEVQGMTLNSLPARGRRKRKPLSDDDPAAADETAIEEVTQSIETDDRGQNNQALPTCGSKEPVRGVPPRSLTSQVARTDDDSTNIAGNEDGELRQFEFMDHTADVILHSWGRTLEEAFAQVCVCFFSYMTDLDTVESKTSIEVEASGHDILDLLYHLLDEFLFSFGTELIVCRWVQLLEFDKDALRIKARGCGEKFDLKKHPQGTEIKAITMHQMKVLTPETLTSEEGSIPRKESTMEGGAIRKGFPFECYVLVDI